MTLDRLDNLRHRLRSLRAEAIIVGNLTNVRYLTGFTGTAGMVYIERAESIFYSDFRYKAQAAEQVRHCNVSIMKESPIRAVARRLRKEGLRVVAVESHSVTLEQKELLDKLVSGVTWVSGRRAVEKLRAVKDVEELAILRKAIEVTDRAYETALNRIRPGITERELAFDLERSLLRLGAEGKSFETIVASGLRSALPHGVASDKRLQKGDLVTIDFGGRYQGYCADLSRTVCVGKATPEQRKIYSVVRSAQLRAEERLRAGVSGKSVDQVARDYISDKGYGKLFGHGLGHGVGLDIHEAPRLSNTARENLLPGNVVTVEPGIYLPGWGGVRIEDVAVLRQGGCEILTRAHKPARLPEL